MCITNKSWDHFDPIEDETEEIEKVAEQPPLKQPVQWGRSYPAPTFNLNTEDPE